MPFDPNKPYEEIEFDPSADYEEILPVEPTQFAPSSGYDSPIMDAAGGVIAGVARGVPFAQQAVSASKAAGAALGGGDFTDEYSSEMGKQENALAQARQDSPIITGATELLTSAVVPGGILASTALEGAESLTRYGDIERALTDAAMAAGGGIIGKKILGKAAGLPEYLSKKAGKKAAKAAESAIGADKTKRLREEILKKERLGLLEEGELGRQLLDEDLIKVSPMDTYEAVAKRREELGKYIGETVKTGKPIKTSELSDDLLDLATSKKVGGPETLAQQDELLKTAGVYEKLGDELSPEDLLREKSALGQSIDKDFLTGSSKKEAGRDLYGAYADKIKGSMEGPQKELYEELNKKYGNLMSSEKAALGKAATPESMTALEGFTSTAAVSTGNIPLAVAMQGRAKLRQHGAALKAIGLDATSKALDKISINPKWSKALSDAADKGTMPATHYLLMQKDPEYRQIMNEEAENERSQRE